MIRLSNVSKAFRRPDGGRIEALREIDLEVEPGELVAVVGPSGSGKSTLMNILGLLDRPDAGDYELLGLRVSEMAPKELARTRNRAIGFVFQQFHLLPRTTARENVELPLIYADAKDPGKRAADALVSVGLEDRLSHYPSELSGGQQQRVAIARALVNDPEVILADEPTGNLDRASGRKVMDIFRNLNEGGTTIVLITHDRELAKQASRTVRIEDGRLESQDRVGRRS